MELLVLAWLVCAWAADELGLPLLSYPRAQMQGAAPLPIQESVFLTREAGTQEGKAERLCLKLPMPHWSKPVPWQI